ncbi:efflux transporter outer membrane subunit [Bacteroides graminisolvens]|uniref:efflux transporter outer membrane subunit n=1 Tax=Bacteroides graminisolvens TaxID=477666 RepID=UPI0024091679|nr:efflux transporter outer membrane subunit [Bacteroides graminisolvens]
MKKVYIKRAILPGIIFSVTLSSCNITKQYKTPEVSTENMFRDTSLSDTTTIADIPWKEYFKDPILRTLIDECLNNNYDLKIAEARMRQAGANLSIAKAAYYPTVALAGQVNQTRSSKNGNALRDHANVYTLGIATTWELDIWGKLNRQSKAKYAQLLSSQEYRNLVQTNLVAGVATSYYTLLSLDEQLKISNEAITLLRKMVVTTESLRDAGLQNTAAVEQMKATLYSTEVSIPELECSIREMENTICVMLGKKPGPVTRNSFTDQIIPTNMKMGLPVHMLANRPDVKGAELDFRAAFELAVAAQASLYPSITLGSSSDANMIGYTSTTLSNFFKPENIFANILGGLTQPLFAGNQLRANIKIQKASQEIALYTFEKTVLTASQEVSDILYTYKSSFRKNEKRSQQITALKNSVEYTQLLLEAGEANYIEVITAEQNLLEAQLGQVKDKLEQLQAGIDLYKALGGGIK